jgi:hypothetical protein
MAELAVREAAHRQICYLKGADGVYRFVPLRADTSARIEVQLASCEAEYRLSARLFDTLLAEEKASRALEKKAAGEDFKTVCDRLDLASEELKVTRGTLHALRDSIGSMRAEIKALVASAASTKVATDNRIDGMLTMHRSMRDTTNQQMKDATGLLTTATLQASIMDKLTTDKYKRLEDFSAGQTAELQRLNTLLAAKTVLSTPEITPILPRRQVPVGCSLPLPGTTKVTTVKEEPRKE